MVLLFQEFVQECDISVNEESVDSHMDFNFGDRTSTILDSPITKQELDLAIARHKACKAAGEDKLISEIITYINVLVPYIQLLFNVLFEPANT